MKGWWWWSADPHSVQHKALARAGLLFIQSPMRQGCHLSCIMKSATNNHSQKNLMGTQKVPFEYYKMDSTTYSLLKVWDCYLYFPIIEKIRSITAYFHVACWKNTVKLLLYNIYDGEIFEMPFYSININYIF